MKGKSYVVAPGAVWGLESRRQSAQRIGMVNGAALGAIVTTALFALALFTPGWRPELTFWWAVGFALVYLGALLVAVNVLATIGALIGRVMASSRARSERRAYEREVRAASAAFRARMPAVE